MNIIIKFPYNARSDWLKQRTLSENKVQVHDIKLAFKFLLGISTHLTQTKHPMCESDKININELFVSSKYAGLMETITDNSSVQTGCDKTRSEINKFST